MAVYSSDIKDSKVLVVQTRYKVFDLVTIELKNDEKINGEIIFIDKDSVYITGPYQPIRNIKIAKIANVTFWCDAPENWK